MFRTEKENEAVIFKMLHQNVPVIPGTKALLDNFFLFHDVIKETGTE